MQYIYADSGSNYYYFIKPYNDYLLEPIRELANKLRYTLSKYNLSITVELAAEANNNSNPNKIIIRYPTKQDIKILVRENYYVEPTPIFEFTVGAPQKTVEKELETTKLYP